MYRIAIYGTAVVVLATASNLLHAVSHVGQNVMDLHAWQWTYVTVIIFLAPIVAAVLLWTPRRVAGAWLLLGSMAGSFAFDFAYHFLLPGPDNVFTLRPGQWLAPFWATSVSLVAVTGIGTLVGVWVVSRTARLATRSRSSARGTPEVRGDPDRIAR